VLRSGAGRKVIHVLLEDEDGMESALKKPLGR
jgi:hypothetical protein